MAVELLPAERIALTVATSMLSRGENPGENVTAALALALNRLTGVEPTLELDEPDFETTSRGFKHAEPIETDYGHLIRIYESSAAMGPHLWLAVDATGSMAGDRGEVCAHLNLEQAIQVCETIGALIAVHYQLQDQGAS